MNTGPAYSSRLSELVHSNEQPLLSAWIQQQLSSKAFRADRMKESDVRQQSQEFLSALAQAMQSATAFDIHASGWANVREILAQISKTRANQGFTPAETA